MSLDVHFDVENYLKGINDIRVCNFFLGCLYMRNMTIRDIDYYNNIRSCKRIVIQAFGSTSISGQNKDSLCKEIETAIEKEILPPDEFDWVKNDEHAAFWACAYLLHTPIISNQMVTGSDNIYCPSMSSGNLRQYHNEYIYLGFRDIPDTHDKRFKRITRFFDHLSDIFHTPDKNYIVLCPLPKKRIIVNSKNKWGLTYQEPLPVKWLPDQEDVVSWARDFIRKYFSNHHPTMWGPNTTYNFIQNTTPLNYVEKLPVVRTTFDLWRGDSNNKKLFSMNLNKAWNQKRLRETRVNKEALNTYLRIRTKIQLDELTEYYDMRISGILEKLISQHYRELFQEKRFCFCAVHQDS